MDSDLRFLDVSSSSIRLLKPIICTCISPTDAKWGAAIKRLEKIGGGDLVHCCRGSDGRCNIKDSLQKLKSDLNIKSVLVEGGANIIQSVLEHQLVNQVVMTIKTSFLGGYRSLTHQLSKLINLIDVTAEIIEGDVILHGYVSPIECDIDIDIDIDNDSHYENGAMKGGSVIGKLDKYSTSRDRDESRDIVEEWKKYAEKSENMYKKLYPVRESPDETKP